jgi:uncharacterized protein
VKTLCLKKGCHGNNPAVLIDHFTLLKKEIQMEQLVRIIAEQLVDRPDDVTVNTIEGSQTTVLELKVAKEDLGKIIGREGRNAHAIRTLLSAVSTKARKRAVLEIVE